MNASPERRITDTDPIVCPGVGTTRPSMPKRFKSYSPSMTMVGDTGVNIFRSIEIADKPGAAAIQSHYEMNKSKYKVPEKRTADYVFFKTEEFKKDIKVVEADIESYYKENIAQFKDPEKIKVSRVYLPFTDKDKAQVLATAEDILTRPIRGYHRSSRKRRFGIPLPQNMKYQAFGFDITTRLT